MAAPQRTGLRNVVLAGSIVLTLTGAGVAAVWAGTAQSATPLAGPTASATQLPGNPPADGQIRKKKDRAVPLHGESVVKKGDGGLETRLTQQGAIDAVSGSSITVRSEDGFSQVYAISAETEIRILPPPAADGTTPGDSARKRLKPPAATAAELKTGDQVRITGVKDGSGITAGHIVAGAPGAQGPGKGWGQGMGNGLGHGLGKKLGNGHWKDDAPGPNP
ncbi:MAG TPA: hypothetical protein VLT34_14535 [Arthrobacter sp.]|nr:hypothetical protein [Arthrobacter sp.]